MIQSEIEYASIKLSWKFKSILSQLPGPATEEFSFLVGRLAGFGLTAKNIILEQPTTILGDIGIAFDFFNPRIRIRTGYDELEVSSDQIESEDISNILKIIDVFFHWLVKYHEESSKGTGEVKINLHIRLLEEKIENYFSKYVSEFSTKKELIPEAFIFYLSEVPLGYNDVRITVANSTVFDNSLFIELVYETGEFDGDNHIKLFEELESQYLNDLHRIELDVVEDESGGEGKSNG